MAHALTTQKITDGRRNTVIKVNIKGDGVTGELANEVLFDASAYFTACTDNKLVEIKYTLNGFSAELFWDATANVPLISLAKDHPAYENYRDVGGIVNNSGAGKTGDILISTTGLAASTKDGYIELYIIERGYITP